MITFALGGIGLTGLLGGEQHQPVHDDFRAALLIAVFVFPVTGVQAAFHVERRAFLDTLSSEGRERAPADELVEFGLALAIALGIFPRTIRGQPDDAQGLAGLGGQAIGIARGVPEECDAVHIEHKKWG